MKNVVLGFTNQLVDFPAGDLRRRRVHEGRLPLQVEPIDAFTGRIEDVFVAPLELLQFLGAGLDVQLQYIL